MIVTLPFPPRDLSPNARAHWARKAKVAKSYRHSCWARALEAKGRRTFPETGPLRVEVTFYPPDLRRRDRDNMIGALKNGQDGVAQAIGVDDSRFVPTYHVGPVRKGGAVLFEVLGDVVEIPMRGMIR